MSGSSSDQRVLVARNIFRAYYSRRCVNNDRLHAMSLCWCVLRNTLRTDEISQERFQEPSLWQPVAACGSSCGHRGSSSFVHLFPGRELEEIEPTQGSENYVTLELLDLP